MWHSEGNVSESKSQISESGKGDLKRQYISYNRQYQVPLDPLFARMKKIE